MSTEIPDDVRKAAEDLTDRLFRLGERRYSPVPFNPVAIIASAILAERERAAQLADELAKRAREMRSGRMGDADMCWYSVEKRAEGLAAAIRGSEGQ